MANTMDRLLPCPFCGKAPRSRWYGADVPGAEDGGYWGVDCCMAHSHADSEAEAVAAWNRRATSEAQGDAGAVDAWERRLRGRAGPFTAQAGERYVDADVALEAFRFALALAASATSRTEPVEGRESECPWGGCGDCVGHEVTQPAGDGAREGGA